MNKFDPPKLSLDLGYTRVSTDRQELSLDAQTSTINRVAELLRLGEVTIYADDDTSGTKSFGKREEGRALLEHVRDTRKKHQDAVITLIVPKLDRLGRDNIDTNLTVRELDALNVRMCIIDLGGAGLVDTKTAMGRFFLHIASAFAQMELERIKERIKEALNHKKSRGELCGTTPFGWDAIETGEVRNQGSDRQVRVRKLVDNIEEQTWILRMYEWREQGWSYGRIAKELNKAGVKTKQAGRTIRYHKPDSNRFVADTSIIASGKWQQGNVAKVLDNDIVTAWLQLRRNTEAA